VRPRLRQDRDRYADYLADIEADAEEKRRWRTGHIEPSYNIAPTHTIPVVCTWGTSRPHWGLTAPRRHRLIMG
jgi:putative SOS response-associated peptidase YedK